MRFEEIRDQLLGVPFIGVSNARYLYDLIVRERLTNILELGIAHGTATCYMAAALEEIGGGKITAVDLLGKSFDPSPEEQLGKTGLSRYVDIHRMKTGYTWFLHDEIARRTVGDVCEPAYDLCIIDGPKQWTIDGCAFFLADKLLKKDGFMIFDDYSWTFAMANGRRDATCGINHRDLSEDELNIPHIGEVFELLVKQHPEYTDLKVHPVDDWAIARKAGGREKTYTVEYRRERKDAYAMVRDALGIAAHYLVFRRRKRSRCDGRR